MRGQFVYAPPPTPTRTCIVCGRPFEKPNSRRAVCSDACRLNRARQEPKKTIGTGLGVDRQAIGAMGEMLVSMDLIARGFFVYRNVSASGPCDLVAFRRGETPIKVEVKVGHLLANGRAIGAPCSPGHDYDTLAVVLPDRSIRYYPLLQQAETTQEPNLTLEGCRDAGKILDPSRIEDSPPVSHSPLR